MADEKGTYEDRLLRVISYIHENIDGDLSLDTLADIACMSRFHWHRVFSAMTGETVADMVRRIRLHKASLQLIGTADPIVKIADRFGYPNQASFTRAFTAAYGLAPGAFRDQGRMTKLELIKTRGTQAMYPVNIENCDDLILAAVAHNGPYQDMSIAFETIVGIFMGRSMLDQWAGMAAIYHDDPDLVDPAELRSHAGVVLARPADFPTDIEGVDIVAIPAGKFAVVQHQGSYSTLQDAYQWFFGTWLAGANVELRDGPPVEFYVNNPRDTAPEELRTDIRVPIV